MRTPRVLVFTVIVCILGRCLAELKADEGHGHCQSNGHEHMVAGEADVLRDVPKKFATFLEADLASRSVRLLVEGDHEPTKWTVNADAEIKVHAWWGRLDQLHQQDRVWVWFAVSRKKQPTGILMIADEISEQYIHGEPLTFKEIDANRGSLTLARGEGEPRMLELPATVHVRHDEDSVQLVAGDEPFFRGRLGEKVFVQSSGSMARLLVSEDRLEQLQTAQKSVICERWRAEGLPGMVSILHPLGGEMEIMLDHEAMRWGRYLRPGDDVELAAAGATALAEPIKAKIRHVRPWRERTQLRLVTHSGLDQADLIVGQRIALRAAEPPAEVQSSELPTDIGRERSRQDRIDWFLATVYCSCTISGDHCTGMFYTQASCNVKGCPMPGQLTAELAGLIDKSMTDEQILTELQKSRGPLVLRQHLLR